MNQLQPPGFLAQPITGKGPGVLVLHPWWGLNDTIRAVCEQLAGQGYVAFAPDLYHGQLATTIQEAEALSGQLDFEQAQAEVAEALAFLSRQPAVSGDAYGVIGFSLGAFFALQLSTVAEQIRAVVLYYGTGPGDFSSASASYLGHYAENDPYEPPDAVEWLQEALRDAGRPVEFHHYPGTGHWFSEVDQEGAYDPAAAELAWARSLAFLQTNLSPD